MSIFSFLFRVKEVICDYCRGTGLVEDRDSDGDLYVTGCRKCGGETKRWYGGDLKYLPNPGTGRVTSRGRTLWTS